MSFFSGMGQAKREISSNWLNKPGRYIVRVDECHTFSSPKDNKEYFTAGLVVLHVIDNSGGLGHLFGEEASWSVSKQGFKFLEKVKNFVMMATGCINPDDITEEVMNEITGANQALAGYCLEVAVRLVPKKTSTPEKPDLAPRTTWMRAVPNAEVKQLLTEEQLKKLYPNGITV